MGRWGPLALGTRRPSDGVNIAYQVLGDGPSISCSSQGSRRTSIWNWQLPSYAQFLRRLSSFCRLIIVDRRGVGISDRFSPEDLPLLEVVATTSAWCWTPVGSERASIFAADEGSQAVALFVATHPERVERLIIYTMDPMGDFQPWDDGFKSREEREAFLEAFVADGDRGVGDEGVRALRSARRARDLRTFPRR